MNFNLNVSKDLVKMSSEKVSLNNLLSSGSGFEDIIASMNLDDEKTSSDKSIDIMELLQNLLSNIKLYKEMNNTSSDDSLKKQEILKVIDSTIDKINNQKTLLSLSSIDRQKLINLINDELGENLDLNFNLDFTTILKKDFNKDQENINKKTIEVPSKELSTDEVFNIYKMSKKTEEKTLKTDKIWELETVAKPDHLSTKNMIAKLDDEIKSLKSYEELSVSTNVNKSNVVDVKPTKDDKDLNILENILDKGANAFSVVSNKPFIQEPTTNNNLPVVTIRANHISDDFIKMVKYLKNNNMEEIKVNINPKELGDMTIKLVKDSEATKILINVGKEDTYNMINKNINDINKHLFDLGIKAKDIVVTMKSNGENLFSDNLNQQFNKREEQKKQKRSVHKQVSSIEDVDEMDNSQLNFNILA
jgi:flagellar hook-length control protein FliK